MTIEHTDQVYNKIDTNLINNDEVSKVLCLKQASSIVCIVTVCFISNKHYIVTKCLQAPSFKVQNISNHQTRGHAKKLSSNKTLNEGKLS